MEALSKYSTPLTKMTAESIPYFVVNFMYICFLVWEQHLTVVMVTLLTCETGGAEYAHLFANI